jgi:hypothetical protein
MSAEILMRAAADMRAKAEAATSGPWGSRETEHGWSVMHGGLEVVTEASVSLWDSEHIASWHPAVATAVADLLDHAADEWDDYQWPSDRPLIDEAVDLARAYLGES